MGGVRILLAGVIPKGLSDKIVGDEFCRRMPKYKDTYDAIREVGKAKDSNQTGDATGTW